MDIKITEKTTCKNIENNVRYQHISSVYLSTTEYICKYVSK